MQRLLLVVAVPLILMLAMAVAGISSSCGSVTETMVRHELQAAQYAFEVSVSNIAAGSYMYTNGKFYKGSLNPFLFISFLPFRFSLIIFSCR